MNPFSALQTAFRSVRDQPALATLTILSGFLHIALLGRYDIFRNELYFIVCGWHPAFGYADQPPLVPLLSAATQLFGENIWLLRLPAALAFTALIPLTAAFARQLGGTSRSAVLAAAGVALSPALGGMAVTTNTSSFEPLSWTLCAYLLVRGTIGGKSRALIWFGVVAGLAMEAKYGIAIWLAALTLGLLLAGSRRVFASRHLWMGAVLALLMGTPSLIWQAASGWPFLEIMLHHHVTGTNFTGTPLQFGIGQILAMNILLAPLWLAGLIAPFFMPRLAAVRFVSIACVLAAIMIYGAGGKDYYLFPVYPSLLAVGAVAVARTGRILLGVWFGFATLNFFILAPVALPLLDPPALARYLNKMHLRPPPDEAAAVGAPLTQVFSDEQGWRELERQVASIYHALPEAERRHATILASNYGEAAAIDFYGRKDDLPRAISGEAQYFLWGPGDSDGSVVILVNGDPERWRAPHCRSLEIIGKFGARYAMPYENDRPITVCRGLQVDLHADWGRFRRFQMAPTAAKGDFE